MVEGAAKKCFIEEIFNVNSKILQLLEKS
jgi:hypothetical protein